MLLWIWPHVLLAVTLADSEWREKLVPSFEAFHRGKDGGWKAPGASSFLKVTAAMQQLQEKHNITEDLVWRLPFLPEVTTFNLSMSDGVQIWTRVVNPWPWKSKKPAVLVRSPYGSMSTQNLGLLFLVLNGQAVVMQEIRGTWDSGGVFDLFRDAGSDAKDTMDWIVKQDWNDGDVYSMGASADGITAVEEVLVAPKNLHGQWIIWTSADGHHFTYPGGAYRLDLMTGYLGSLNQITRGVATSAVLPATKKHEAYGPWWYNITGCRSISDPTQPPGCRYRNVKWPLVFSAAWWDLFHHTMLDAWFGIRKDGDPVYRDDHVLVVGPLGHNIAGKLNNSLLESTRLAAAEVEGLLVSAELTSEFWQWRHCSGSWGLRRTCKCQGRVRFGKGDSWSTPRSVRGSITCKRKSFDKAPGGLRGECQCQQAQGDLRSRIGRVNLFVMGAFGAVVPLGPGNYWTSLEDFPTPTAKVLYLGPATLGDSPTQQSGTRSFKYDPRDPPPMIGGNNLPDVGTIKYAGSADQLPRESRADVKVFDSKPLAADLPVVGAVSASLFVSSSAPDTDFLVTVSDLHPGGTKSMLVRFGIQRMRWRESDQNKSAPLQPDHVYAIDVSMGYTAYVFPKGHSIRVSISSAADPYFNPTSNTGVNDMVTKADPIVAENTVHFGPTQLSKLVLPEVSFKDIPANPDFGGIGPFDSTHASDPLLVV